MHNKRFIAGASCPQCAALDKIFTYSEAGKKWRACAQCSFVESFDEHLRGAAEELPTRVNQQRVGEASLAPETARETAAEAVVMVDMDNSGTKRRGPGS